MAEPSACLQQKRREKVTYPRCGRSRSFLKSKEVKWCPLAGLVTVAGGGEQVLLASRPSPGASPSLATIIHRSLVRANVAWASATPAPGGRAARSQVALGEARLPVQEDEENATFVSCSHLALAARGGGARGGRCGSAPPTGNF